MANYQTPWDADEAKRMFAAKVKQMESLIKKAAAGDENLKAFASARDRAHDLVRFTTDDRDERERLSDRVSALNARFIEAKEKGYHVRVAGRNAEIARLREEHRASLPAPHSYEAELYKMRHGR